MKSIAQHTLSLFRRIQALGTAVVFLFFLNATASSQTKSVLYSFSGRADGAQPVGGLVLDTQGNLYGTTEFGGSPYRTAGCCGTVFKLTGGGTLTTLHAFFGPPHDAEIPLAGLVRDERGNLYGTTYVGGASNVGTVFRLTANGKEKVLYSFTGSDDGRSPQAGLLYVRGDLYGTTSAGGVSDTGGTVFELAANGTEATLYSFSAGVDGAAPLGSLIQDAQGNFYGTTSLGGTAGYGAVFEIDSNGVETVLYNFAGPPNDGANPEAGLVRDSQGNLYGTTFEGGAFGVGTVFEVTPAGEETVLYSFTGKTDGSSPFGGLIRTARGNLYGTTRNGGSSRCAGGCGTVFELTPVGRLTSIRFTGTDGEYPVAGLVRDSSGNLYGTTSQGGAFGWGEVFKITP
jgi:uncharacterized repeat protein (TIGR03803 family)